MQKLAMRIKPHRFEEKMARLYQYRDAGRRADLLEVFLECGVTERTLDDWLARPNENATYVKNGTFDKILRRLPDLEISEHVRSYRLALRERGLDEASQQVMKKYNGLYEVYSNFAKSPINLISLRIHYSEDISFPVFKLRSSFSDARPGKNKIHICDGYTVLDGRRLIFTGIGEYFTAMIVARASLNSTSDPMHCTITIEDRYSDRAFTSSGALKMLASDARLDKDFVEDFFMEV